MCAVNPCIIRSQIALTGMKQGEFAEAIGMQPNVLSKKLNGQYKWGVEDLILMADYFKCSIDYLIGREVPES